MSLGGFDSSVVFSVGRGLVLNYLRAGFEEFEWMAK